MTRWSDLAYFLGGAPGGPIGLFSPDGSQFVVVDKKGDLEHNTNEFSILLFQTSNVFKAPKPQVLVTRASSSNRDGIKDVRWLSDSETLVFLGENPGEIPEVYCLNVRTRHLKKLTNHPTPIVAYDITPDGHKLLYEAEPPTKEILNTEETKRNGVVITSQYPSGLLEADCKSCEKPLKKNRQLFLQVNGHPASRISSVDFLTEYLPLSISPTGTYALLQVYMSGIPWSWANYQDEGLHPYIIEQRKPGAPSNVTRYMVLDTRTHEMTPFLDAPVSWYNNGFAWSKDGYSVVVSGSYLPLNVSDPEEREAREKHTFVVEVRLPSREIVKITDKDLTVTEWNQTTGRVLLKQGNSRKKSSLEAYKKVGSSWKPEPLNTQDAGTKASLHVTLEEDINNPPKIFVSDPSGEHKTLLYDLNPQFSELAFGKVETITWKASDGHEARGGLYLPPDYVPRKRYPLVIQTHGYDPDRFWIDGPWDSAFAAQPLASKGFVVVQADEVVSREEYKRVWATPQEGPHEMYMFEGLVDDLDGRGLIDRNRVGLIGFSRTCYHVEYTLTHSKYRFAAAVIADGFDGGYVNNILFGAPDYAGVNGGMPFGSSLSSWMENSPGFNTDKVQAATRIEYYGYSSFLGGWQWFSSLSMLHKPVDYVWLPFGTHLLVKPWERMISQQGTVDWFAFWLKNEEEPDPAKAQQYKRWRELRQLQDENERKVEAPVR